MRYFRIIHKVINLGGSNFWEIKVKATGKLFRESNLKRALFYSMNKNEVLGAFLFIIGIAWNYHALAVFLMDPCNILNQCLTTAKNSFAIPTILMIVGTYLFRN